MPSISHIVSEDPNIVSVRSFPRTMEMFHLRMTMLLALVVLPLAAVKGREFELDLAALYK